jgi:hypothetical protein
MDVFGLGVLGLPIKRKMLNQAKYKRNVRGASHSNRAGHAIRAAPVSLRRRVGLDVMTNVE